MFTPAGEWIAGLVAPSSVMLRSVLRDRVLGVRVDEMDVAHVVAFELRH